MPCLQPETTGTLVANHSLERCAASLRPRLWRHGGARNSASRISHSLTPKQTRQIIAATHEAERHGKPFNRHITIHWEAAGVPDNKAMAATTAFLKAMRDWTGGKAAYLWVRENGDAKGSHVHILAHIAADKSWHGQRVRRWIERISGQPYIKGAIFTRKIKGCDNPGSELYQANLAAVLAYILKGANAETTMALGIAHEPGGQVIGKRCGWSRNISPRRQGHPKEMQKLPNDLGKYLAKRIGLDID